jgi:hypothetical protein
MMVYIYESLRFICTVTVVEGLNGPVAKCTLKDKRDDATKTR